MIADAHCHAWERWPYDAGVPDPSTRGSIEQVVYEMDRHEVEQALLVCARIGSGDTANGDNNEYGIAAAARYPGRIAVAVDVDCSWRPEYHTPGAAARLRKALRQPGVVGFTHYVRPDNDRWFVSQEGLEFFAVAAELDAVASLAISPAWHEDLRTLAKAFPTLPILVHHMGAVSSSGPNRAADLAEVLASAAEPNILVKVSGFHYLGPRSWGFPYSEGIATFRALLEAYGPRRLCWGSDFPAARSFVTYTQSLEVVRSSDVLGDRDRELVLGGALAAVLDTRRPPNP